eukprot:gb/GECH01009874.1/.p1 GENE.gb/GECH01009874.1/~~gb/GECH01009874.1/.p1  ORF type:complete len:517 (+),score=114.42 gb/GECH01009874.1/:1-1551(+)
MTDELEIESSDVVRLMLQFCKENSLPKTFKTLQEESKVSLNTVENAEQFRSDILNGRWDHVLRTVASLSVPSSVLMDLYEHVVLELLEAGEKDVARQLLRESTAMESLENEDPERYLRLDHLLSRTIVSSHDLYQGISKEKRRAAIAQRLLNEVSVVESSRLLTLIGQSLRWQQSQGLLSSGSKFDLFKGTAPVRVDDVEACPTRLHLPLKMSKKSYATSALFSPDGQHLVTGSIDGFIEVWDIDTGKVDLSLKFQSEDKFMVHRDTVTCLDFTQDGKYLASGSADGTIKVWKFRNGKCVCKLPKAHGQGVKCLCFSPDGTQILSGSYDCSLRIHGLKSKQMLKDFHGHTSYVNDCIFTEGESVHSPLVVVSASSDGTVCFWDIQSMTPNTKYVDSGEATIHDVHKIPNQKDAFLVCSASSSLNVINSQGEILKTYPSEKSKNYSRFTNSLVTPKGEYILASAEDGYLYGFNTLSGDMEKELPIEKERDILGLCHHPTQNMIASFISKGKTKLWTA